MPDALIDRLALALRASRRASASERPGMVHPAVMPTLREMATALLVECDAAGIRVELRDAREGADAIA